MKAPEFVYARAATLDDAFRLKAQHGPDSRWLAGGQSLLASLAFRLSEPTALIDISAIAALQGITLSDGHVRIGAGTTHTSLGASGIIRTHAPLIADTIPHIAHTAIRNRGTIGGSLAFADPAAELPACCVALDATFVLASATGERRVPARAFFHGVYATAMSDGELLTAIEVPTLKAGESQVLDEVTRRSGDYAMAGVAAVITRAEARVTDARLVFFALGDRPIVAVNAAAALVGHPLDETEIDRAAQALARDLDPPGDLNGSPATKLHLAQVVLRRALAKLTHAHAHERSAA
jgi:aerobic carbon-monoxide dehydrogenase medium subunit